MPEGFHGYHRRVDDGGIRPSGDTSLHGRHPAGTYARLRRVLSPRCRRSAPGRRWRASSTRRSRGRARERCALTGRADEPPRLAPAPLATCAAAALDALCALAPKSRLALEAARADTRRTRRSGAPRRARGVPRALPPRRDLPWRELPPAARGRRLDRGESPARRRSRADSGVARGRRALALRSLGRRRVPRRAAARRRGRRARPPPRPRRVGGRRPRRCRAALAARGRARRTPRCRARAHRAARARSLGALGGAALRPAARARRSPRGEGRKRGSPRRRPLRAARLLRSPQHRQAKPCPRSPRRLGASPAFAASSSARTP